MAHKFNVHVERLLEQLLEIAAEHCSIETFEDIEDAIVEARELDMSEHRVRKSLIDLL